LRATTGCVSFCETFRGEAWFALCPSIARAVEEPGMIFVIFAAAISFERRAILKFDPPFSFAGCCEEVEAEAFEARAILESERPAFSFESLAEAAVTVAGRFEERAVAAPRFKLAALSPMGFALSTFSDRGRISPVALRTRGFSGFLLGAAIPLVALLAS
jgi:hypothetical protein